MLCARLLRLAQQVPKTALDALRHEVSSADAYGLQAGAEQLATAVDSDSIPVKLKALNVLVSVERPHFIAKTYKEATAESAKESV